MAKEKRQLQVTKCPTYSDFFEHLIRCYTNEWEMLFSQTEPNHNLWCWHSCS